MPGVIVIEQMAFEHCNVLSYIECGKLERIENWAFKCTSLSSIDLPSIKIVEGSAFSRCIYLTNVKFGKELESIRDRAFPGCRSLERITIPLKDGIITSDCIFWGCNKLESVDLVGGVHETIAALLLGEWKNEMNEEVDAINRILPSTPAGSAFEPGGKAREIRVWIGSVLRTYTHYKAEHRRYLNVAAAALQQALPKDILFRSVLPFVDLPTGTFDGED